MVHNQQLKILGNNSVSFSKLSIKLIRGSASASGNCIRQEQLGRDTAKIRQIG
jgi:hypothetical protein